MEKLPPIEKIPEAYTAIVDKRVSLFSDYACVKSSDFQKEYLIKWRENVYYSNDNSTYWQSYAGYPLLAVFMLQEKLSFNEKIAIYFKNINWHTINKEMKNDYKRALDKVLENLSVQEKEEITKEIQKVMEEIKKLDITLTRKKNF